MNKEMIQFWTGIATLVVGRYLCTTPEAQAYIGRKTMDLLYAIEEKRWQLRCGIENGKSSLPFGGL